MTTLGTASPIGSGSGNPERRHMAERTREHVVTDGQVSRSCVVAYGTWILVGVLILGMWVAALTGSAVVVTAFGITGAATSAVAATAHVRKFLCEQEAAIRNAFELGRDSVRVVR